MGRRFGRVDSGDGWRERPLFSVLRFLFGEMSDGWGSSPSSYDAETEAERGLGLRRRVRLREEEEGEEEEEEEGEGGKEWGRW